MLLPLIDRWKPKLRREIDNLPIERIEERRRNNVDSFQASISRSTKICHFNLRPPRPERGALSQVTVLRAGGASSARHQTVICLIARSHDHQQQHQKLGDDHCGGQESDLVAVALGHLLGSNRGTRGKNRDYGNVNVLTICGSR